MKQLKILALGLLVSTAFISCDILSIHPLANRDELIFDEAIVGNWFEDIDDLTKEGMQTHAEHFDNKDSAYSILSQPAKYVFEKHNLGSYSYYDIYKTTREIRDGEIIEVTSAYELKLTEIDGVKWASIRIGDNSDFSNSRRIGAHTFLVRANGFAKVNINENSIELRFLSYEWFKAVISKNRMKIDYELVGSDASPQIVLTANTEQLRNLMARIDDVDEAFEDEAVILNRK
ncbi:MAG: hypothetical protein ACPGLV_04740 [Bacteroidia bacterium]